MSKVLVLILITLIHHFSSLQKDHGDSIQFKRATVFLFTM